MSNPSQQSSSSWACELSSAWDYLGPFPIHAREQHLLSPSYPLNLSWPVDYNANWPSSYADNGRVSWQRTTLNQGGSIEIAYPEVRWSNLRATEGWAALQHHVILRTTLTLFPKKSSYASDACLDPRILVNLKQGSYFTLRPKHCPADFVPRWFAGNIYDLEHALPVSVDLPGPISVSGQLEYELFISGDYEIRLFGDPQTHSSDVPTLSISISIEIQDRSVPLFLHESQHIIPDFVDGFSLGNIVGLAVQSLHGFWAIKNVFIENAPAYDIHAETRAQSINVAPFQTRIIPVTLIQSAPFDGTQLTFKLEAISDDGRCEILSITLPVKHHNSRSISGGSVLKGSFLFSSSSPSLFLATPPISGQEKPLPPILALHGAGVDILSQDFWTKSLPTNHRSWIISPTGRTSWGLDWHGPSVIDAFSAVVELSSIVRQRPTFPSSWRFPHDTKVVVIGHSNGGQGTWHLAARYPDKIIAAIPAAGYLKSQAYIPLTMGRGYHFVDPMLRAILEASLTPDDNDLHLSNLVDIPILAIHGGDDENVPVWHTREAVSVLKSWSPSAKVVFKEDPGEGHWYSDVFQNPTVQQFLDEALDTHEVAQQSESFTLTVANTRECGSLHGWKIEHLMVPGRLGRLSVEKVNNSTFNVASVNVYAFSIFTKERTLKLIIDGRTTVVHVNDGPSLCVHISKGLDGWEVVNTHLTVQSPPGRLQAILTSPGPIFIIVADSSFEHNISVAQRLTHILQTHHRLDCEIVRERTAIERTTRATWTAGNIVFVGPRGSMFASNVLAKNRTPVRLADGMIHVGQQAFNKQEQAILFTHPHPSGVAPESFLLFIIYNSESALERAIRLFPFRTGVPGPDWIVTGQKMDEFAAGGIEAAGMWGRNWTFNEPMSWLSQ